MASACYIASLQEDGYTGLKIPDLPSLTH